MPPSLQTSPQSLSALRAKHSEITYRGYSYECNNDQLHITYDFFLSPNICFAPSLIIPYSGTKELVSNVETLIFALGLVELISYWKCACPPTINIECGTLSPAHHQFLRKLFIHGLGEFYFINKIDCTAPDFFSITSSGKKHPPLYSISASGDCVLVAGGKDSSLLLELLRKRSPNLKALGVSGSPSTDTSVSISKMSLENYIKVQRTIDPALIKLNSQGYLNGHTPFSALLSHLALLVGALYGIKNFYVGNERSASEGNTTYNGLTINHQYSKSFEYEKDFREFARTELTAEITYASYLRPLYEIQIAKLFAQHPHHFRNFKSCNVHQKKNTWCLGCPKCIFVYLMMRPWINAQEAQDIFNGDPLRSPNAKKIIEELCGLSPVKPLECVGTRQESILGVHLTQEQLKREGLTIPEILIDISARTTPDHNILHQTSSEHFLTPQQISELKELL